MSERKIISTKSSPAAIGAYNQAIVSNGMVYTSGQIPLDPKTGEIVSNDFSEQVEQVFLNMKAVLNEAGSSLDKTVKLSVFLTDLSNFALLNIVFEKHFKGIEPPARSVVEVSALPKNVLVEIECIATI